MADLRKCKYVGNCTLVQRYHDAKLNSPHNVVIREKKIKQCSGCDQVKE